MKEIGANEELLPIILVSGVCVVMGIIRAPWRFGMTKCRVSAHLALLMKMSSST
jgi:hypothetical protein